MSGKQMLLVVFLALAASSQTCVQFTCGVNTSPSCYTYITTNNTGVSSFCAYGSFCPFRMSTPFTNQACIPYYMIVNYNAIAGEKCDSTNLCETGLTCTDGYCQGLTLGAACDMQGQCEPGLYCLSGTCVKQQLPGASCQYGIDYCAYGYECNNSICTKMYSIAVGNPVDSRTCYFGTSILCSTGNCYYDSVDNTTVCIDYYVRQGSNTPCTTCTGVNKYNSLSKTINCMCGLSGSAYCPGFSGDTYQKKAFLKSKSYHLGRAIKKCNVAAGNRCMKDHWNKNDYYEFNYYNYMASNQYLIEGANKCVVDNLLPEYVSVLKDYESAERRFDGLLGLSAFLIALFHRLFS